MINKFKSTVQKNRDYRSSFKNKREISDSESDTDLDRLISELSKISIETNLNSNNMAEVNYSEVRLFLDIIPSFSGEPCELSNFISACDEAVTQYAANQTVSKLIFRGIIGKLKGKALTLVSSRAELTTWAQIKFILKQSFSDQRSFNCLLQELHNMKPQAKESSYSFGVRCQYLRSLICSSINNDITLTNENKLAQIQNIEKLILITFQKYLTPQIQLAVRLKNPNCLEEAMQYLIEEENFISIINDGKSKQFSNSAPQPNHFFCSVPKPNFQAPIYHRPISQQQQTPYQNRFPSQPINITPRNLPQQKYFTNKQVFGKSGPNVNVWQPKNTIQPKPTPMSGVSIQTTPKSHGNFQHSQRPKYFQPQSRPTFISEELYNLDETESNLENYMQTYYPSEAPQEDCSTQDDLNQTQEEPLSYIPMDENTFNPNLDTSEINQETTGTSGGSQNFQEIAFLNNPT